mmetsp:Transcript_40569/g.68977  ORF Transcript_40569/g.68977 Transcript_40569/m.68977 type:complete len:132 (+) Transcript_40569:314-709(+)
MLWFGRLSSTFILVTCTLGLLVHPRKQRFVHCLRYLDCSIDSAQASFAFSGALALDHPCPEGTAPGLTALEIRRLGLNIGRIELLGTWPQHSSERQEGDALDEGAVLCVPLEDLFDIGVVYVDGNTLNRGT